MSWRWGMLLSLSLFMISTCGRTAVDSAQVALLDADNPVHPIPPAPRGVGIVLTSLRVPPTKERVRLGRWLFFDKRLSKDGTISCATCHQPKHAFSHTARVATGVAGSMGARKIPTIINLAVPLPWSNFKNVPAGAFFWDGRARTLEEQALEPIANPLEMGNTHAAMIDTLGRIRAYAHFFEQTFDSPGVTTERVAHAIADYVRTRMSGNSRFDRWITGTDDAALSRQEQRGWGLFAGPAQCGRCHRLPLFTDGKFHNLGIGWDPATRRFADYGRHAVTKGSVLEADPGTFKTPTLREVTRHPPYMHDGSIATLREVVEFYNRGAVPNPDLAFEISRSGLRLTPSEIDDIVAFLGTLEGEGWQDSGPSYFPQ
jgi:cytochrome c peroxidase